MPIVYHSLKITFNEVVYLKWQKILLMIMKINLLYTLDCKVFLAIRTLDQWLIYFLVSGLRISFLKIPQNFNTMIKHIWIVKILQETYICKKIDTVYEG